MSSLSETPLRVPVTFATVAVLAPLFAALLPPRTSAATLAAGTVVGLLSVAMVAQSRRVDGLLWFGTVGPLVYLIAIALMRHAGGGATSGLSPLVLLPLFWVALTGNRRSLAAVIVGIVGILVMPILLVGDPTYPAREWSRAGIWLAVAPTVGLATQELVARVRDANVALEGLARTDTLTGLLNRRGFMEFAHREVVRARRTGEPLMVAMVDLDFFKNFNDTHGHPAGDRLLAGAAEDWAKELREVDVLGRWGGEEFIILLPRCPEPVAHNVLDRVREATPDDQTCSIGFAAWRQGETVEDVTARADKALYAAKEAGRNCVMVG